MFLGRSQSILWGLLCNNYWELKINILDLMRRYMDLHPTNQWRINAHEASSLLTSGGSWTHGQFLRNCDLWEFDMDDNH
jgi:hypothetical protein